MAFYIQPPGGNISLQKLTQYAVTRLKFLCQVYQASGDRMKLHDVVLAAETVEDSECLIDGSVKDKISHFILRLASLENKEMSDFLVSAETALFDFRFSSMSKDELVKCFRSLDQQIRSFDSYSKGKGQGILELFRNMKREFNGWKRLIHKYMSGESSDCFQVPFQTVLHLVSKREVLLNKGTASVPVSRLRELITNLFSQMLVAGIHSAKQNLQASNGDGRILRLFRSLKSIYNQHLGKWLQPVFVPWSLTHEDVDRNVDLFPPCMSHLHRTLRQQHRLTHHARVQYTLFLKEAGLPVHEALMFWRKEYLQSPSNNIGCCHSWSEHEDRYTYNIRHLYGLEGSRINYRGHFCKALQEMHVGANCDGGCPFSQFDASHLYNMMKTDSIEGSHSEVLALASQRKYTQACAVYLTEKVKSQGRSLNTAVQTMQKSDDLSVDTTESSSHLLISSTQTPISSSPKSSSDSIINPSDMLSKGSEDTELKKSHVCHHKINGSPFVHITDPNEGDMGESSMEESVKPAKSSDEPKFASDIYLEANSPVSLGNSDSTMDYKIVRPCSKRRPLDSWEPSVHCKVNKVDQTIFANSRSNELRNSCEKEEIRISKPVEYYVRCMTG